jgi:hypothetical protein
LQRFFVESFSSFLLVRLEQLRIQIGILPFESRKATVPQKATQHKRKQLSFRKHPHPLLTHNAYRELKQPPLGGLIDLKFSFEKLWRDLGE